MTHWTVFWRQVLIAILGLNSQSQDLGLRNLLSQDPVSGLGYRLVIVLVSVVDLFYA